MQKNDENLRLEKSKPKIVQKSDLGESWAPFGKGLGRSGASWGHFWAHFDCLLDVPNPIFSKQWSKMGPKRSFGWLLNRFGEILDVFWTLSGAFGRSFWPSKPRFYKALVQQGLQEAFWKAFGSIFGGIWAGFGCVLGEFGHSKLKLLRHMVIS